MQNYSANTQRNPQPGEAGVLQSSEVRVAIPRYSKKKIPQHYMNIKYVIFTISCEKTVNPGFLIQISWFDLLSVNNVFFFPPLSYTAPRQLFRIFQGSHFSLSPICAIWCLHIFTGMQEISYNSNVWVSRISLLHLNWVYAASGTGRRCSQVFFVLICMTMLPYVKGIKFKKKSRNF